MENAVRSIACAVVCAGSIIGAGLAAGGENGYFVVLLGCVGFAVFGLLTVRMVTGTANVSKVVEYLVSTERPGNKKSGDPE